LALEFNDLERQNRGLYGFFWRFWAATQVYIIHKVASRNYSYICDPDREFGICVLT